MTNVYDSLLMYNIIFYSQWISPLHTYIIIKKIIFVLDLLSLG